MTLILNLAGTVENKLADSFLKLLTENHGALPDFITCFKAMKDIRIVTIERVLGHYLKNEFKKVDHICNHGLIATMYLRDPVTLIKTKISVTKLIDILSKHNWKALRRSHPMNSNMRLLLVARSMYALMSRFCPPSRGRTPRQIKSGV